MSTTLKVVSLPQRADTSASDVTVAAPVVGSGFKAVAALPYTDAHGPAVAVVFDNTIDPAAPRTYAMAAEDTKGASSTAENAFTNKATIPLNTLAVGDELEGYLAVEVTTVNGTPQLTTRFRLGSVSGVQPAVASVYAAVPAGAVIVMSWKGRVYSVGANLVLRGIYQRTVEFSAEATMDNVSETFDLALTGGPATTADIDCLGTVQFDASHASNTATVKALSVVHRPRRA